MRIQKELRKVGYPLGKIIKRIQLAGLKLRKLIESLSTISLLLYFGKN